jgi:hypothetical protein
MQRELFVSDMNGQFYAESIEWFMEDQAFSPSYDFAPTSPLPPPSVGSTSDTQEGWERETNCWREMEGEGVGEEQNYRTAREPGPL